MAWSDVELTLVGSSGNTVTVSARNPQQHSETFRIRVTATLTAGGSETLTSNDITLQAGQTAACDLHASSEIDTITDGPDPIEPG